MNRRKSAPPRRRSAAPGVLVLIAALVTAALWALSATGMMRTVENRTVDYRFASRGRNVPVHRALKIVALDEETFEKMSEPFSVMAAHITTVTEGLLRAGVAVVGIDGMQEISLESFVPGQMRRACLTVQSGKVVLISYVRRDGTVRGPLNPLGAVAASMESLAPSNLSPDDDEVIRRHPVNLVDSSGAHLPTFPFALAARYVGSALELGGDLHSHIGPLTIHDESGYVAVNYAGGPGTFPAYSFHEVCDRARRGDVRWLRERFRDALVIISRTDNAGKDYFETPFSVAPGGRMSGAEIYANTINTVLQGRYLSRMTPAQAVSATFLLCLFTALLAYHRRPLPGALAALGAAIAYIVFAFAAFTARGYVASMAAPAAGVPLVYGAVFVYRYLTVDRRARRIRETFGKLVSQAVVEELWKENLEPRPGSGAEKRVTVLFSDINNFTPTCAGRPPSEVISMLNDYYTEMVDITFRNKGMLLHFVGDEVITAHGATHDEPHQALLAVRTAVEMVRRLRVLKRERTAPGFYEAKIGINTGSMVVGFLGSAKRMEFTTIGESVNLAARIESLNKKTGTEILVSEATYDELVGAEGPDLGSVLPDVEFVKLEPQEVKGFDAKVTVYEVRLKEA